MSRAVIAIEDAPNGRVGLKVTHVDGFSPNSNAHKLSVQIVKWLDEQCAEKEVVTAEEEPAAVKEFHQRMTAPILVPR
jgi:hypothetical protein